jgi:hypothetical protein
MWSMPCWMGLAVEDQNEIEGGATKKTACPNCVQSLMIPNRILTHIHIAPLLRTTHPTLPSNASPADLLQLLPKPSAPPTMTPPQSPGAPYLPML